MARPARYAGHGRRRGGRRVRRIRLALATALLLTAGVLAAMPDPVSTDVTAVALTKDLPAGAVLSRSALRTVAVREVPDGALRDPAAAVGRTLAAPVRRGELVTDVRLVTSAGPDPGRGRAAVPIHPADTATVDLLGPGMHVVIVTVTGDAGSHPADPTVLARTPWCCPSAPRRARTEPPAGWSWSASPPPRPTDWPLPLSTPTWRSDSADRPHPDRGASGELAART